MIHFFLLFSRQGKLRLSKWYSTYNQKERTRIVKEITPRILSRPAKLCNFLDWRDYKLVYRRYAKVIHHFVEVLDQYFGNVCELDLIFNFHKAYYILDETLIFGELQEPSKKCISRLVAASDEQIEQDKQNHSMQT